MSNLRKFIEDNKDKTPIYKDTVVTDKIIEQLLNDIDLAELVERHINRERDRIINKVNKEKRI